MSESYDVDRRCQHSSYPSSMTVLTRLPSHVLLERLPAPILLIGEDAAVLYANPAFVEMLGYHRDAFYLLTLDQIFPQMPLTDCVLPSFQDRAGRVVELAHADQSIVRARMSKSALLRQDDAVALVMFEDMTEQIWTDPRVELRYRPMQVGDTGV